MTVETQTYDELVSNQITAIQAQNGQIQFPVGSVELAIVQANAGLGLWMQAIVLQLLAQTRAASCVGTQLDSFFNQFNFYRNLANTSSGQVIFSRNTSTNQALVPVGSLVQTQAPSIQFSVYADDTNSNYNPTLMAYVLAPTISSISIPVVCTKTGIIGNVNAGAIIQIASPIVGIDAVNNPSPLTNGYAQESDSSYLSRFVPYINSLSLGTILALETAITNGTPQIFYNILPNKNISDLSDPGFVTIIIDDGSGSPPTSLINLISQKIGATIAAGITYGVYPVSVLTANFTFTLTLDSSYIQSDIITLIQNNIGIYISSLEIGQTVVITKIYQIIYNSSAAVLDVTGLLINGISSDLVPTISQRAYVGTYDITVT
jgi:uncharacterized phage protein gp47/JayE